MNRTEQGKGEIIVRHIKTCQSKNRELLIEDGQNRTDRSRVEKNSTKHGGNFSNIKVRLTKLTACQSQVKNITEKKGAALMCPRYTATNMMALMIHCYMEGFTIEWHGRAGWVGAGLGWAGLFIILFRI